MRGDGRIFQRGQVWWIDYYVNGRRFRERAGTEREAQGKLRKRLAKARTGTFTDPREERATVNELLDALITHSETRGRRALGSTNSHLKPIREAFGHLRALTVTAADLELYVKDRLDAGYANATVNRGLQGLRAAYNLARRQQRLSRVPHFPMLREENVRHGFFEAEDFDRFVALLPAHIADATRFAYRTGWRKGEVVGLTWDRVDRAAREARLHTSKNGTGRVLPLVGSLWDLIERRWALRVVGTRIVEFVFHRQGKPLGDFRKPWKKAAKAAGVPGVLFHDLRRTAARNLVRSGVPETVAMSITGHKTRAMFDRYNITSQADQRAALARVETFPSRRGTERAQKGKGPSIP